MDDKSRKIDIAIPRESINFPWQFYGALLYITLLFQLKIYYIYADKSWNNRDALEVP